MTYDKHTWVEKEFINSEKLKISYLQSGDIAKISYDNTMLNMYPGTM